MDVHQHGYSIKHTSLVDVTQGSGLGTQAEVQELHFHFHSLDPLKVEQVAIHSSEWT